MQRLQASWGQRNMPGLADVINFGDARLSELKALINNVSGFATSRSVGAYSSIPPFVRTKPEPHCVPLGTDV